MNQEDLLPLPIPTAIATRLAGSPAQVLDPSEAFGLYLVEIRLAEEELAD